MRLIDADTLIANLKQCQKECKKWHRVAENGAVRIRAEACLTMLTEVILRIRRAETIDAVPVVRCKDCAHCEIWKHPITNNVMYFCTPTKPHITDPDGYCDKGEKRNAEID